MKIRLPKDPKRKSIATKQNCEIWARNKKSKNWEKVNFFNLQQQYFKANLSRIQQGWKEIFKKGIKLMRNNKFNWWSIMTMKLSKKRQKPANKYRNRIN